MDMADERLESCRADRIREIFLAGVGNSPSGGIQSDFRSGDSITIQGAGCEVRGRVDFNLRSLRVTMLSPFEWRSNVRDMYCDRLTFWRRKPTGTMLTRDGTEDGPASDGCIRKATSMLRELYCDWYLLDSRKEEIAERCAELAARLPELEEREARRRRRVLDRMTHLKEKSHTLKMRLQSGEISQEEYIRLKEPVRSRLRNLQGLLKSPNFFLEEFEDIRRLCKESEHPGRLIRAIAESKD